MPAYISPGSLIALGSVLPALGIVAVGLRFHVRRIQKASLQADDWLITAALLTEITLAAALLAGVAGHGLGYPTPRPATGAASNYELVSPQETLATKVEFIFNLVAPLALGLAKLSIVFFYRRIFYVGKQNFFSIATWLLIGTTVLFILGFSLSLLFGCGAHPETWWAPFGVSMAECFNGTHWLVGMACTDFILDALVLLVPIVPIMKLQMPLQRRLAVLFVFLVGALTVVASIIKMYIVIQLASGVLDSAVYETEDPDILTATLIYWTALESGLGVIVACLPTCHVLFRRGKSGSMLQSLLAMFTIHSSAGDSEGPATKKDYGSDNNTDSINYYPGSSPAGGSMRNGHVTAGQDSYALRDLNV